MDGPVLIAYPDRLAGSIAGLTRLLSGPLAGVFPGVHLLPFFHPVDGTDTGFDPDDQRVADPSVGSWDDVRRLAEVAEPWTDMIVTHVTDSSPWFLDYAEFGEQSPYAGMFLTYDGAFPHGATEEDLLRVVRRRCDLPLTFKTVGGAPRLMWTTLSRHRIDLDLRHPMAWRYLGEVMDHMADNGVRHLRLGSVGYVSKEPGTTCFMLDSTYDLVGKLCRRAHEAGLDVVAEAHAHYAQQTRLAEAVDRVYDFALPPLLLHAVHSGDVEPLLYWLEVRPENAVTVLDTHDGIALLDVAADLLDRQAPALGLLMPEQIDRLVESVHAASGGVSRRASEEPAGTMDLGDINCTWFDALGRDEDRMVLTRLVQVFLPGMPHVYYVGLLAGTNDEDLLRATGVGRSVNRHRYRAEELADALATPVVRATLAALRLRSHPAFDGQFRYGAGGSVPLWLQWQSDSHCLRLDAQLDRGAFTLHVSQPDGSIRTVSSVADLAELGTPGPVHALR